jgi:intracellular septation protein A
MVLSRRWSAFLLAFGVWSWVIWPTFLRNIWADDRSFGPGPDGGPTGFLIVHALLTGASLAFGTAIGVLGARGLARRRTPVDR